jgi:hypothetical protein
MFAILARLLTSLMSGSLRIMLLGAGVGLVTNMVLLEAFQYYVARITSGFTSVSPVLIQLAALLGVDKVISIILSAIAIRVTIKSAALTLGKLT